MARPHIEEVYTSFLIHHRGGETELVQVDYDFPPTAQRYGWNTRRVQPGLATFDDPKPEARVLRRAPNRGKGCDHGGTDGTVDCGCGVTASDFISAASEYLSGLC